MLDLSKLEGKRIPLTQKHIDAGVRGAVRHHPIALALNEVVDKDVSAEVCLVRETLVFCSVIGREKLTEFYTTSDLEEWAWNFENGMQVFPAMLSVFQQDDEDDETDQLWIGLESETPITYRTTADSLTAFIVFSDGEEQTWEAHGTPEGIELIDYDDVSYTTVESLKKRGIRCFVLENRHEVEVD